MWRSGGGGGGAGGRAAPGGGGRGGGAGGGGGAFGLDRGEALQQEVVRVAGFGVVGEPELVVVLVVVVVPDGEGVVVQRFKQLDVLWSKGGIIRRGITHFCDRFKVCKIEM